MRARRIVGFAAFVGALALVAGAGGASTPLPGGTSLDVTITSPTNGATVPLAPLTVSGTAAVGRAAAVANTLLIYVVDVSGSTVQQTGICPNQNVYDITANTTLDCELQAVRDMNATAISSGTVGQVGLIAFGGTTPLPGAASDAQALDLSPTANPQLLIPPGQALASPPQTDLDRVAQSAYLGSNLQVPNPPGFPFVPSGRDGFSLFTRVDLPANTNYWAAMTAARSLAAQSSLPNKLVVMLSDGDSNTGGPANQSVLQAMVGWPAGLTVDTFAIGQLASCSPAGTNFGTLQQIATASNGTCEHITDPSNAATEIPAAIASHLTGVSVTVDGGSPAPAAVTPTLPQTGPATANWTASVPTLTPGPHHICATATGSDGGGTGSSQDCVDVTVKAPPTVTVGDGSGNAGTTDEGTAFPISATASDGTTTWAIGTGPCTFANASLPSTTVTCFDNGTYTLLFRATDGINPPVFGSETLTVRNVAPTPTLTLSPAGPYPLGEPVTADVSIVDPGTLDTETCSIDWGDGTTDTLFVGTLRECTAPHTYATAGSYTVTVTVADKDGGTGSDSKTLVVNAPPVVRVGDTGGNEGSAIPLVAAATDPENDPLQYAWTATPLSGVAPGAECTFSNPVAPSPTITCNDNGVWTITLTVGDGVNQPVSASGTLTVQNVAPHATLTFSPGPHAVGSTVTADVAIADPGAIDTFGCTFEWGDGTPTTSVAATGSSCSAPHAYAAYGSYHVTVTVVDKDGGTGLDTQIVVVDGPPVVRVSDASGNEGSAIPLTATATDPEGDALTYAWTATPISVDPGASCTFSHPASVSSTVTCNDSGTWTITLTASDGINPPVPQSATLTVANVAPTLTIVSPPPGASSRNVVFNGMVTDPGSNDVLTCTIDWGDGSAVTTVPVVGGFCNTTHTYADAVAAATITATASDNDGATATKSVVLTFNRPPVCSAVVASPSVLWPPDHKLVLVTLSGATDPDTGDTISYTVTGVTQDEPLLGTGSGDTSPDAKLASGGSVWIRAERSGGGDGRVYTIAFTVSDSHGATCSGTTTVSVPHDAAHAAVLTPGQSYNSLG